MGFGAPVAHSGSGVFGTKGFLGTFLGEPGSILSHTAEEGQAIIPSVTEGPPFHFPESSLVYFQFVFAAITPILALGSVLGRVNFKAWIPYVALWITFVYAVNAFLIWGGGYFAAHGALDYSGGYVIHLSAGVSGFVFAAVIGPRLQRDREVDAPNNLLMLAVGAGLLWLGWNGFNGGDSYYAGADASAAVLNTNLCTAVAMMVWIAWDYIFREKPSMIGAVNGMITGLVDRRCRCDDRVVRDPLPQPRATVQRRRRHPGCDLHARDCRTGGRPVGGAASRSSARRVHRRWWSGEPAG
jgi:Amt family ammonium transporter